MCEKREPPVGDCLLWTPQLLLITAGSCASAFSRGRGRGFEGMGFVTGGRGGGHCARVVRAFLCMKSQEHPRRRHLHGRKCFINQSGTSKVNWLIDHGIWRRPIERRPLCFLSTAKHTPLYRQQHLFQPVWSRSSLTRCHLGFRKAKREIYPLWLRLSPIESL